jgi:hypothetical protein
MVVIHHIRVNDAPGGDTWVLIEFDGERFVANGFKPDHDQIGIYWTPAAFDTLYEAIAASIDWASANGVPLVYVKDVDVRTEVSP